MSSTSAYTKDVMVDLETLGTTPTSPILAIGAVQFMLRPDEEGRFNPEPFSEFYANVLLDGQGTADDSTFRWWLGQSEGARKRLSEPEPVHLMVALLRFTAWLHAVDEEHHYRLWAHGPHFDEAMLHHAYESKLARTPWRYSAPRDLRTYCEAAGIDWDEASERAAASITGGVEHDALYDARLQAKVVQGAASVLLSVWPQQLRAEVPHDHLWQYGTHDGVDNGVARTRRFCTVIGCERTERLNWEPLTR